MEIENSVVTLNPGIYILRHPKQGLPPLSISRAPAPAGPLGTIESIWTQGTDGALLRDGSDCIVIHVQEAPVALLVSAFLPHAGAAKPVLRVDQIGLDQPAATSPPTVQATAANPIEISPHGLSLIGHLERRGDMAVAENQYLGDPEAGLRVEGFQLMWPDRPQEVDLAYSVTLEGNSPTPTVTTGQFCGSRSEARRITEVTFSLVGADAHKFTLSGTAHFSGGFTVPVISGLPLNGPSGFEHLTALKLSTCAALPGQQQVKNPWDQSARTRVFKAKRPGK